jgi:hypothetical protein
MVTWGTAIAASVGIIDMSVVGVREFAFLTFVITVSLWVLEEAIELEIDIRCVFIPLSGLGYLPFHIYCLIAMASCS